MSWQRSYVIRTKFLNNEINLICANDIGRAISAILEQVEKDIKSSKAGSKFKNIVQHECGVNFERIDED